MANLRWLTPGLGIKRWVIIICAGLMFLVLGSILVGLGLFYPGQISRNMALNPYGVGGFLIFIGGIMVFIGVYRLARRIEKLLKHKDDTRGLAEIAFVRSRLDHGAKIVCLGGGTGLNCLLGGLRDHTSSITAIVSVADDGGSSGRLRSEFGMLPPGDIRNCISALADAGPVMTDLMQYRFSEGELSGHSFGNLFIMVLAKIRGNFGLAVREANRILNVRGQVLPATLDHVTLVATHTDGTKTTGQRHIAKCGKPIEELALKPAPGATPPDVLDRIRESDIIIIGPGSLFTSIIPNLLAEDVTEAISASRAKVVFVINTMEQPGETQGFKVSDYINALKKLSKGTLRVDEIIVNNYRPSQGKLESLQKEGINLTEYDADNMSGTGIRVLLRDVIDLDNPEKHDPQKLARVIIDEWENAGNVEK